MKLVIVISLLDILKNFIQLVNLNLNFHSLITKCVHH